MCEIVDELKIAADLIAKHKESIFLEDEYGYKYEVVKASVIGAKTDDPGLLLKVVHA